MCLFGQAYNLQLSKGSKLPPAKDWFGPPYEQPDARPELIGDLKTEK